MFYELGRLKMGKKGFQLLSKFFLAYMVGLHQIIKG